MNAVKTYYRLIPSNGEARLLDTMSEALDAAHKLRKRNRGYFLYEVTEIGNKKESRFMSSWRGGAE